MVHPGLYGSTHAYCDLCGEVCQLLLSARGTGNRVVAEHTSARTRKTCAGSFMVGVTARGARTGG